MSPIEIDTQQLISEFQKPWMLPETDTPAVEPTDAAASKTQKENTGDAYLKIHKDMKNNLKSKLIRNQFDLFDSINQMFQIY